MQRSKSTTREILPEDHGRCSADGELDLAWNYDHATRTRSFDRATAERYRSQAVELVNLLYWAQ